jgi:hypothetical protein
MKELIPLFQTALWIFFSVGAAVFFRKELQLLRLSITDRINGGSSIKLGPFEVGELKNQIKTIQSDLASVNERASKLFLTTMSGPMYENLKK